MSRVESAPRKSQAPVDRAPEFNPSRQRAGADPAPGRIGSDGKLLPGQISKGGSAPVGPDGQALASDAMGDAAAQVITLTAADAGLQTGEAGNPFQSLVAQQTQQLMSEAPRLAAAGVDLGAEVEFPDESLAKLLGFEKAAIKTSKQRLAAGQEQMLKSGDRIREASMLLVSDAMGASASGTADADSADADVPSATKTIIAGKVVESLDEARLDRAKAMKNMVYAHRAAFPLGMDVHAFVRAVLREAYMLQNEELRERGEKLKALNEHKKALRKKTHRAKELQQRAVDGTLSDQELEEFGGLLGFEIAPEAADTRPPRPPQPTPEATDSSAGASSQSNGAGSAAASPPALQVQSGLETGNPGNLTDGATAVLPGGPANDISPPPALRGLDGALGSQQNRNNLAIVKFVGRHGIGALEEILRHSYVFQPEKFRQLLRGLLNIRHWISDGRNTYKFYDDNDFLGLDDDEAEKWERVARGMFNDIDRMVVTLFYNASPEQLAFVGDRGVSSGPLQGELNEIFPNANDLFFAPAREAAALNVLTDDGAKELFSLYMGTKRTDGNPDHVALNRSKNALMYRLRHASPESIFAFFEAVGPVLAQSNVPTLRELFSALPEGFLQNEENLTKMSTWMNIAFPPSEQERNANYDSDAVAFVNSLNPRTPDLQQTDLTRFEHAFLRPIAALEPGDTAGRVALMNELISAEVLPTLQSASPGLSGPDFSTLVRFLLAMHVEKTQLPAGAEELIVSTLKVLFANATPRQLAALELNETQESQLVNISGVALNGLMQNANNAVGLYTDAGGAPLTGIDLQLRDLYAASESKPPLEQGRVLNVLKASLNGATLDQVAKFFGFVGPDLIGRGKIDVLSELMNAVNPMFIRQNSQKFAWLNRELAEGTLAQVFSAQPDPNVIEMGEIQSSMENEVASSEEHDVGRWEDGEYIQPSFKDNVYYQNLMTKEQKQEFLSNKVSAMESEMQEIGFDQQIMQMELQELMQKQQQFLTMMSNMSKMMHDVAMSIIRNIGG